MNMKTTITFPDRVIIGTRYVQDCRLLCPTSPMGLCQQSCCKYEFLLLRRCRPFCVWVPNTHYRKHLMLMYTST